MQINKFITMAVGLIVGVLLIAGVVTPVIANVSSDGGDDATKTYTNEGAFKFSYTNEDTDYSIYPAGNGQISLQPSSVADRTLYDYSDIIIITEDLNFSNSMYIPSDELPNDSYLSFNGSTVSRPDHGDYEYPVLLATDPIGDYVSVVTWSDNSSDEYVPSMNTPHAFADTKFLMLLSWRGDKPSQNAILYGDSQSNTLVYGDTTTSATVSIVDDVLSSISFDIDGKQYTVPIAVSDNPDDGYSILVDGLYFSLGLIVLPSEVTGVSGSGMDSNVERTNVGEKYTLADASTNVTLYPAGSGKVSTQPETVADRTVYDVPTVALYYKNSVDSTGSTEFYSSSDETNGDYFTGPSHNYSKLSFEGTTLKAERLEGDVDTFEDIACFTNPIGNYVNTYTDENGYEIQSAYASSDSPMYILIQQQGHYMRSWILMITGTPSSPVATLFDTDPDHDEFALTSDVRISLVENEITEISFAINDTPYTLGPDHWFDGSNFGIFHTMILPEHVGGEDEGGSGGISDTLKATLSVIPLVMTVGLVLGAVAFFRMKN